MSLRSAIRNINCSLCAAKSGRHRRDGGLSSFPRRAGETRLAYDHAPRLSPNALRNACAPWCTTVALAFLSGTASAQWECDPYAGCLPNIEFVAWCDEGSDCYGELSATMGEATNDTCQYHEHKPERMACSVCSGALVGFGVVAGDLDTIKGNLCPGEVDAAADLSYSWEPSGPLSTPSHSSECTALFTAAGDGTARVQVTVTDNVSCTEAYDGSVNVALSFDVKCLEERIKFEPDKVCPGETIAAFAKLCINGGEPEWELLPPDPPGWKCTPLGYDATRQVWKCLVQTAELPEGESEVKLVATHPSGYCSSE